MNIFVNYSSSIKNTIRNLKGETDTVTTQQMPKSLSDAITKSKSEEIHTMIQAIENEVGRDLNDVPLKDIQDAVKALTHEIKSQKSDGMLPKQLGRGFKETVERYKDIDSGSQSSKYPVTEYAKKIGLCDFNCGDAERGVFKN